MLPDQLWKAWQPRVYFPCFAGVENTFEFTIQPSLKIQGWKNYVYPLYSWLKKKKRFRQMIQEYVFFLKPTAIKFAAHYLDANGNYLGKAGEYGPFAIGESFVFRANLSTGFPLANRDGLVLFVGSRGRFDAHFSSPGSMTARYSSEASVCGYRTGFFARALNDGRKHFGFTGLNPAISKADYVRSGMLLMNHSSDPTYNREARPVVRLYRAADDFVEADFGPIPPHGYSERSYVDLFQNFEEWSKNATQLWSATNCQGVSLASFHIYRNREGRLLAIEHSRPAHAQVIEYWKAK